MRKKHILMVLDHTFPPDLRVENEASSLVEAGFDVTILSIGPDKRPPTEEIKGYRVIRSKIPTQIRNKMRGLAGSFPFLTWYLNVVVKRLHRTYAFDAIHAHDLYLFGASIKAGKKLNIPVVGDMHENWVEALKHYKWSTTPPGKWVVNLEKWDALEKRWTHEVDQVIVVIEEMKDRLISDGLSAEAITVVPNTIQLDDFSTWEVESLPQLQRQKTRLIYTGGMDGHRGIEDAIEAMPIILKRYPNVELVLVGDGATKNELEHLARKKGVEKEVLFAGWQDQKLVKSFLAASDIGIIPHRKTVHTDHTIPHKLFHYMYMGLPCVVSDCKPLKRIVEKEGCGKVYVSGNPDSLSDQIFELLESDSKRTEMAELGKRAVADTYNWDATATGLVSLYVNMLTPDL